MKRVLAIGCEGVPQHVDALRDEGYDVSTPSPEDEDLPQGQFDVMVLNQNSVDTASRERLLDRIQGSEAPALILVIDPDDFAAFDPPEWMDDFFVSGATPQEFLARVRRALWKRSRVEAKNVLTCGELTIDLENYTVHLAGKPLEMTYKEYELLRFLATNRDRVVTRETLLNKVWGYDFYGGARTVDVHIRRLRSKIEDRNNTFIETVRHVGYRFRAPQI